MSNDLTGADLATLNPSEYTITYYSQGTVVTELINAGTYSATLDLLRTL